MLLDPKLEPVTKGIVISRLPPLRLIYTRARKLTTAVAPDSAKDTVIFGLEALGEAADAFPPLKSAMGGLKQFIAYAEMMSSNKAEIYELRQRIEETYKSLHKLPVDFELLSKYQQAAIIEFDKTMRDICADMAPLAKQGNFMRFVRAKKQSQQLAQFSRRLDLADVAFARATLIGLSATVERLQRKPNAISVSIQVMIVPWKEFFFQSLYYLSRFGPATKAAVWIVVMTACDRAVREGWLALGQTDALRCMHFEFIYKALL